ncbi:MAG: 16S rRNA pseudouridine 516 synthase [Idiomarinaceae bacterium HL-53]|nr:MAG: 16S rRNA pseudouridine 516 synthase [Idiomarinaceae bacterium HL-53]CUS48464.1 16S rRNA pseudouridine516 synthase [Idiomarinaceae bacterium HL-53]
MRIDRFLSEATGMSRKEATKVMHRGEVALNGEVVKKGVVQVKESDAVSWNGREIEILGPTYFMMNKPAGCVCANDDPSHIPVFAYLDIANPDKLHTAGRLDLDTTGLLLITNDGQWSHRITSPKHRCEKTYRVWLVDPISEQTATLFAEGIQLRGEAKLTEPAQFEQVGEREALVTIHEGKYHQVKRMFAACGNKVEALHRERVGSLALDSTLAPGEYRSLTTEEIALF